jgi:phage terminase large subunit GpA-like protein
VSEPKPYAVLDRLKEPQRNAFYDALRKAAARAYAPPPKMPLDEWADKYRVLSPEAAALPGRWKTDAEPMARGPMRAVTDPLVEKVTAMCGAQILKTEFVLNSIGYYAHGEPGPMLVVYPIVDSGEMFSKERLAPMVRDTPVLRKVFSREKSRASDNTILQKSFVGGRLSIVGANAPAGLASRPIRFVLMDEVDRFPASAGGAGAKAEGDPVGLAEERTSTFHNRKIVLVSTPTTKGASRIESSYLEGDRREFYAACPHCGVRQVIKWSGVKWDDSNPNTARYECRTEAHDPETGEMGCGKPWTEAQRLDAIDAAGRSFNFGWFASRPFKGHASFHASQLSSKRVPLSQVVKKFLEAKNNGVEGIRKWINLSLAETFEEDGDKVDPDSLYGRREDYDAFTMLPPGVGYITAGVDIQRNRWECEIVGWGEGDERWSLAYKVHYDDPGMASYWEALDTWLLQRFRHPTGIDFHIETSCVDSGDNTQKVYDFCRPRFPRRVFAIKGPSTSIGKPIWPKKASRNNAKNIDVFLIGLDNAKSDMQTMLNRRESGAGFCHYPLAPAYDQNYFNGLTTEKAVTKYKYGRPYRVWECPVGARNEPWDCAIYAYAALKSSVIDIAARLAQLRAAALKRAASPAPTEAPKIGRKARRVVSRGVSA